MTDPFSSVLSKLGGGIDGAIKSVADRFGTVEVDAAAARQKAEEGAKMANTASYYSPAMQEAMPWITAASKAHGVPPATLAAMYAQESSAGQDSSQKNKKIGAEAWRMGLTADALKSVRGDASTPEGAINAAAAYLGQRSREYSYDQATGTQSVSKEYDLNSPEAYLTRYADPAKAATIGEGFSKRLSYYQDYFK